MRCTVLKPMEGFQKRSREDTTNLAHILDNPTAALRKGIANVERAKEDSHRLCREADEAEAEEKELLGMGRGEALLEALKPAAVLDKIKNGKVGFDPKKLRAKATAMQTSYKEHVKRAKILQALTPTPTPT